ncbi:MAG: SpaA isopeptide-forming pilin-related protein, partial [Erysipelotrichaceae bacterium]
SNILGTAITDANGKIVFDGLVLGNYFIKETKALEGYVLDDKTYPVVADEDATNDNHDFINHLKRMDVRIKKIDSITGKVLRAAEFTLFDKDGKAITVVKTDKDGIAIFKDVAYGFEGYIMETKAPVGYILSKEKVKVVFNKDMKLDADNLLVIAYPNTPIQDDVVTGVAKPSNTIYTLTALISLGGIVALKRKKKHV